MSDDAQQQDSEAQQPQSRQGFWDKPLISVIVGGVIASLSGIVSAYFTTTFQMSAQSQTQKEQEQHQKEQEQRKVVASLTGDQIVFRQLYVDLADTKSAVRYYHELWDRAGSPKTSVCLGEGTYWVNKSAEINLELTKSTRDVFVDLANILTLFPHTKEFNVRWQQVFDVYTFANFATSEPPQSGPLTDLTKWKDDMDQKAKVFARNEYGRTAGELLNYLNDLLSQVRH